MPPQEQRVPAGPIWVQMQHTREGASGVLRESEASCLSAYMPWLAGVSMEAEASWMPTGGSCGMVVTASWRFVASGE